MRLASVVRPGFLLLENVGALINRGLSDVLRTLAESGYDAEWQVLRASDVGLPHRRERCFIIAYPNKVDGKKRLGAKRDWPQEIFASNPRQRLAVRIQAADQFVGVDDGLSCGVYRSRGEGVGNAVAVKVAEYIGKMLPL